MTLQVIAGLVVFIGAYVLIATEKAPRATVALTGGALMVLLGATDDAGIFFSEHAGIDWHVIFLLLGMMMIVGILRQSGAFEFLAIWAAKRAKGRPFVVMSMLIVITAVLSAALDNVTTVLLIAPVTLLIADQLAVPVVPFLITQVMASNIGGAATLIGDPPNIIIASRANLTFVDFLVNMAPLVVLLMVVFLGLAWLLWGRKLRYDPERAARVMALNEREAIKDTRLLVTSIAVIGLVLVGFLLQGVTHLDPAVVALMGAGLLALLTRLEARKVVGDVEWETLLFFAGLFVMVGGLVNLGVIEQLGKVATEAVGSNYSGAAVALLVGSAAISGIIDNIPYVATMAPLVADLVASGGAAAEPLWWALTIGADLGGNATAVGASANVVVLGIARRYGAPISFWEFTKYGLLVTAVTVAVSVPYVLLRYFAAPPPGCTLRTPRGSSWCRTRTRRRSDNGVEGAASVRGMRCFGDGDPLYERYHDTEWGVPVRGENELFERVCLEAFQSGLAWITILRKREAFRAAFAGFDPERVAAFDQADVERLLADAGIVRNRAKIDATIANARAVLALHESGRTLSELVWSHAPAARVREPRAATFADVPGQPRRSRPRWPRSSSVPGSGSWARPPRTPRCRPAAWWTTTWRAARWSVPERLAAEARRVDGHESRLVGVGAPGGRSRDGRAHRRGRVGVEGDPVLALAVLQQRRLPAGCDGGDRVDHRPGRGAVGVHPGVAQQQEQGHVGRLGDAALTGLGAALDRPVAHVVPGAAEARAEHVDQADVLTVHQGGAAVSENVVVRSPPIRDAGSGNPGGRLVASAGSRRRAATPRKAPPWGTPRRPWGWAGWSTRWSRSWTSRRPAPAWRACTRRGAPAPSPRRSARRPSPVLRSSFPPVRFRD